MMSDIPPTLQDRLKPLFFQKDVYADKLCQTGKDIRRVQLELMKRGEPQGSLSAEAGTFRSLSEARLSEAKTCDQIFDLRPDGPSKETLLRSQRLIDETKYLTAKLRALEREIDGVLTQEMLVLEGEKVEG
ncbi:MAG: hypothetical protein M0Q99_11105 [Candidatus Cloacimonetes bacterium]|nr:hypothetical protein [Candidatus Cloacimonadota bacterium]